jgi:hypothetical protein
MSYPSTSPPLLMVPVQLVLRSLLRRTKSPSILTLNWSSAGRLGRKHWASGTGPRLPPCRSRWPQHCPVIIIFYMSEYGLLGVIQPIAHLPGTLCGWQRSMMRRSGSGLVNPGELSCIALSDILTQVISKARSSCRMDNSLSRRLQSHRC